MKQSVVSVVIPTRNAEKTIRRCLASIARQTYSSASIEVIVADNGSTDKTLSITQEYKAKIIQRAGKERSAQRNTAAYTAKGEYLLFLDADMALSPHVIAESVLQMRHTPSLAGLYIPEIVKGKGFWGEVRNFERSFYTETVIDAVRFVPKRIFTVIKGFDETLWGGEDWDFDRRVHQYGKIKTISSPLYHMEDDFSVATYIKKKMHYSHSLIAYTKKWGANDPIVRKQLSPLYRYIGVFCEKGKWKKTCRQPLLTIGTFFLRTIVGIGYIIVLTKPKKVLS